METFTRKNNNYLMKEYGCIVDNPILYVPIYDNIIFGQEDFI